MYVRNVKILILKKEVMKLECCGVREFVFEEKIHVPVVDALCEFIVSQENFLCIAHNGGRFDTIFIRKEHFP